MGSKKNELWLLSKIFARHLTCNTSERTLIRQLYLKMWQKIYMYAD